jgi:ATP-binding cassette, subfamily B, bacterial
VTPAARFMRPYILRERGALGGAALSTVVSTAADLAQPWPLALVVDRIFANHQGGFTLTTQDIRLLVLVVFATIGIALADAIAQYFCDLWLQRAGERISHRLRDTLYAHLQRLSLGYHQSRPKGDLVTRVTSDVDTIGELFASSLGPMTQNALLVVGMLAVVFVVDPVVALAAFAMTPPLAAISWVFRRRVRVQARARRKHDGAIASMANEALSAMPVVKAHGTEAREHARIRDRSAERMDIGMKLARMQARFDGTVGIVSAIGLAMVIVVGVLRGSAGAITAGELVVLASYARKAASPLRNLAKQAAKTATAMASAERVAEILEADEILEERPGAHRGDPARGAVSLRGVSFAYRSDRPGVLTNVDLEIPAGTRVAVIGTSGAGKTTIGALVARFYDPTGGQVLLDGRDLRDCDLEWLRGQVGVLLQETVLFTGTVQENIAYGSDATLDEIREAAARAGADRFISSMPDGYATMLGPQGVGLSGGQRQRIGIARTLLRNPPVLVLDEPTTGLDAESQDQVMEGLSALMQGRTTVLITHALELARDVDRVIVMRDGAIERDGTPEEILGPDERAASQRSAGPRRPRRAPLSDPGVPQLARLLDPTAAEEAIARSLGEAGAEVEVRRVVYRPRSLAAVHYRVELDGEQREAVAAAGRGADGARGATHDEGLDALIAWLPEDPLLPALRVGGSELGHALRAAGVTLGADAGEPVRTSYKPLSHAVLRLNGHRLKTYGSERHFVRAVLAERNAPRSVVASPCLKAVLPDLRTTVTEALDGERVDAGAGARAAGALVRALQRAPFAPLAAYDHHDHLRGALRRAEAVVTVAPHLETDIARLQRRLVATLPTPATLVPAHGAFDADELLMRPDGVAVAGFEHARLAAPALDLATFAARVTHGSGDDLQRIDDVLQELLAGYGDRPAGLQWYLSAAILARAARPFTRQSGDWPDRVEAIVATAQEVIA